jgi:hypothetical protein
VRPFRTRTWSGYAGKGIVKCTLFGASPTRCALNRAMRAIAIRVRLGIMKIAV